MRTDEQLAPVADLAGFARLAAILPAAPVPRALASLVAAAPNGALALVLRRVALRKLSARFPEVAAAALAAGRRAAAERAAGWWHYVSRRLVRRGWTNVQRLLRNIVAVGLKWAVARRKMQVSVCPRASFFARKQACRLFTMQLRSLCSSCRNFGIRTSACSKFLLTLILLPHPLGSHGSD
jgi:hypothetical protein